MKNSSTIGKLVSSIMVIVLFLKIMSNTSSPKLIFIPFWICGVAMLGQCVARIFSKKKAEMIFRIYLSVTTLPTTSRPSSLI